jgi:hypothetical protein
MCDCRLHRIDAVSNQVHHDLLQLHAISHDLGKWMVSSNPSSPLAAAKQKSCRASERSCTSCGAPAACAILRGVSHVAS